LTPSWKAAALVLPKMSKPGDAENAAYSGDSYSARRAFWHAGWNLACHSDVKNITRTVAWRHLATLLPAWNLRLFLPLYACAPSLRVSGVYHRRFRPSGLGRLRDADADHFKHAVLVCASRINARYGIASKRKPGWAGGGQWRDGT